MVNTTPYDQFDSLATVCNMQLTTTYRPTGSITPHSSNAAIGVNNLLHVSGDISGNVQASQLANNQVSFVWGFNVCVDKQSGEGATLILSRISAADSRGYQDATQYCPTMSDIRHTGTTTVGPDGVLAITFSNRMDFGNQKAAYIGNFVLQLVATTVNPGSPSSPPPGAGTSSAMRTTPSSGSSPTSGSTSKGYSSTGNGGNLATVPGDTVPSITPSWTSRLTAAAPSSEPQGPNTSTEHRLESPFGMQGVAIGGTVAGVFAAIMALIALCLLYRRRRRLRDAEAESALRISPVSYEVTGWGEDRPGVEKGLGASSKAPLSPHEILRTQDKSAEGLGSRIANTSQHPPTEENVLGSVEPLQHTVLPALPSRGPPSVAFTVTRPPAYDQHANIEPDAFFLTTIPDQRVPYTLDETFQVHDMLGEWAEEHRDAVPYHLERRLRAGGYTPGTHPREISPEVWMRRFAVARYELEGLIELFERTGGAPSWVRQLRLRSVSEHSSE